MWGLLALAAELDNPYLKTGTSISFQFKRGCWIVLSSLKGSWVSRFCCVAERWGF